MDLENPAFARVPAKKLYENVVDDLVRGLDDDGRILGLVIDGKAAAGKSTWAGILLKGLQSGGRNAVILEADWFLRERRWRDAQMKSLRRDPDWGVLVPTDFHLHFWDWNKLNQAIEEAKAVAETGTEATLELKGLYNRESGDCDAVKELIIGPGDLLIVPGCYLLDQISPDSIDFSILLYVNKEEGRRRKLNREMEKGEFPTGERMGVVMSTWELIE